MARGLLLPFVAAFPAPPPNKVTWQCQPEGDDGMEELQSLEAMLKNPRTHPRFRSAIKGFITDRQSTKRKVKPSVIWGNEPMKRTKTLSALSETAGAALIPPARQPAACNCGACGSCERTAACNLIGNDLAKIDVEHRAILQMLRNAKQLRELRTKLMRMQGYEYWEPSGDEDVRAIERRLREVAAQRQRLVDELCQRCGVCPMGEES